MKVIPGKPIGNCEWCLKVDQPLNVVHLETHDEYFVVCDRCVEVLKLIFEAVDIKESEA